MPLSLSWVSYLEPGLYNNYTKLLTERPDAVVLVEEGEARATGRAVDTAEGTLTPMAAGSTRRADEQEKYVMEKTKALEISCVKEPRKDASLPGEMETPRQQG